MQLNPTLPADLDKRHTIPGAALVQHGLVIGLGILAAALFLFVLSYRLHLTPDLLMDEMLYYTTAFNIASDGAFTWGYEPIFVHPPGQFLVQSLFLKLLGLDQTFQPFLGTYSARLLNVLAASLTVGVLYALLVRLVDYRLAFLACLLLLTDPFVIRINRRNMLETLAEMWVVIGLYLFWHYHQRMTFVRLLVVGAVFGLAFLTKELTIFAFMTIPIFQVIVGHWKSVKRFVAIGVISVAVWGLFPLWSVIIGQWHIFLDNKTFNVQRLLGMVQVTGWNRPGVSFVGALKVNFPQYATSYILLLLGAACTVYLFFVWRTPEVRFLVAWALAKYGFFAFSIVQGALNDQFFYFLMVPVAIVVALSLGRMVQVLVRTPHILSYSNSATVLFLRRRPTERDWVMRPTLWVDRIVAWLMQPLSSIERTIHRAHWGIRYSILTVIVFFITAVFAFNSYRWVNLFAIETDNSLYQIAQFIEANAPEGATINSMFTARDRTVPFTMPNHNIVTLRNPKQFSEYDVYYSLISSKNLWGAYGDISPNYYEWIQENGELVFETYGNTFWDVGIYEMQLGKQSE